MTICTHSHFDVEPPDHEQDDVQEHFPINQPPTLELSKNSGGPR